MKKYSILFAGAAMLLAGACAEETIIGEGEGTVSLNVKVSTDMTVVSRSTSAELEQQYGESLTLWLANSEGVIRQYHGAENVPVGPVALFSGHYRLLGWAGDSVSASWTDRCFKGTQEFDVVRGTNTAVTLNMKIANSAASVVYEPAVKEVLRNCTMTVGHVKGELTFDETTAENARAYFMLPSYDRKLRYTFRATQLNGAPLELSGEIDDPQPATCYVLTVRYTRPEGSEQGGLNFRIEVDDQAVEITDEVEIVVPPTITGYGFDADGTVTGEQGTIGRRTFYISTSSVVKDLVLSSDELTPIIGEASVDFLNMSDETARTALAAAGINATSLSTDANGVALEPNKLLQLNLEGEFTNALENGLHTFTITATDIDGRTSTKTLTINVSAAKAEPLPLPAGDLAIYTNRATLTGRVVKEGVSTVGFNYRAKGTSEWTYAEGTPASRALTVGSLYSAIVTGLEAGTEYEYVAVADGEAGSIPETFTTESATQLPNAGFEEWGKDGKAIIPAANTSAQFWDSGNHGSATMNKNITDKATDYVHSGTYSAKLVSQFVGVGSIGKFAAGNIFAGKYLQTNGTDGVLGWGRAFTSRPSAMKFWARYAPGTVIKSGAKAGYLNEGDTDRGIVYVALTTDALDSYTLKSGEVSQWPVVVNTKASEQKLFNPEADNIVAYGRVEFNSATDGGLQEYTITLDYRRTDVRPSYIVVVASASIFGDYFCGGEQSTLWLDDLELVY